MKLGLVAVIITLVTVRAIAHAQQGAPPSNAPKPTKEDAQKLVQIVTGDKAKTQAYCDLDKLFDQMEIAEQKNDSKTIETLGKQADLLAGKIGPEYNKVMGGLDQVDPNSTEGKELISTLFGLERLCSK